MNGNQDVNVSKSKQRFDKKYLFNLPTIWKQKLQQIAFDENVSIAVIVRRAIKEYLKKEEENE